MGRAWRACHIPLPPSSPHPDQTRFHQPASRQPASAPCLVQSLAPATHPAWSPCTLQPGSLRRLLLTAAPVLHHARTRDPALHRAQVGAEDALQRACLPRARSAPPNAVPRVVVGTTKPPRSPQVPYPRPLLLLLRPQACKEGVPGTQVQPVPGGASTPGPAQRRQQQWQRQRQRRCCRRRIEQRGPGSRRRQGVQCPGWLHLWARQRAGEQACCQEGRGVLCAHSLPRPQSEVLGMTMPVLTPAPLLPPSPPAE
jgi:hypothetical protein